MGKVYERASEILEEIDKKCSTAHSEIPLVMAVTKNQPVESIEEARRAGFKLFGENRIQEYLTKKEYFDRNNLEVHLIGHLQSNKTKHAVDSFSMIQSIDSVSIASSIDRYAENHDMTVDVLIEVNIGRETNKYGFLKEDIYEALEEIGKYRHISVKGLMTIPPLVDISATRSFFREMKSLYIDINDKKIDNISMKILSMGMSSDYMVAIEEGSSMVRIGSAIFT